LHGAIDVGVSGEPPTEAEAKQGALAIEYAKTPFVFATSNQNAVSGLTVKELVEIYSGKTTAWPDGQRLRLVLRPEGDSDNRVLRAISPVMDEAVKKALSRAGMKIAVTDQDSADAIHTIPGALGTSTLALIISENRPLKALSIDGVLPSPRTIADGSYPYFKPMYIVTRPNPSELTKLFIAFVRSDAGRRILARLGHWVDGAKAGN
jgi:phosphate transport system substrate-binding protein